MQESNHLKRIKSSFVLLAIGIPLLIISKWTYALVIAFFLFLACKEFLEITDRLEFSLNKNVFRLTVLVCFSSSLVSKEFLDLCFFFAILFTLFFHTAKFFSFFDNSSLKFLDQSATAKNFQKEARKTLFQSFLFIFGLFYISWMPGHEILLRSAGPEINQNFLNLNLPFDFFSFNQGLFFLVLVRTSVIVNDICSYYFGKHLGKHKLSKVISPNKTLEGSLSGILFGILVPILLYLLLSNLLFTELNLPEIKIIELLFFLLLINLIAQTGDLFESLIKRAASKKDSGDFFSGQGGIMDRCDSHVLTALPTYYFFFII